MQPTSPKLPPSKTIHDQLRPFRDLPLVRLSMHFQASVPKSRLSGPILTFTLKCQQNHLTLCLLSFYDSLSRSFVETTIKANRIGPDNRDYGEGAGKCINNRTRKISDGGGADRVLF